MTTVTTVLLLGFPHPFPAHTGAWQKQHFGVLHQTIGNRRRDGRVVEDVAPFGERAVGSDDGALLLAVARGDDLIEQVGCLLIEREIAKLVADQQFRLGIAFELAHEGMIHLRSEQVIEHVHRRRKQDSAVGLAGAPGDDLRQQRFADPRIADDDYVGAAAQEPKIEQLQDTRLQWVALVAVETEDVNGGARGQARHLETPFDGALLACAEFQLGEPFQSGGVAKILLHRFGQRRVDLPAECGEVQFFQFQL